LGDKDPKNKRKIATQDQRRRDAKAAGKPPRSQATGGNGYQAGYGQNGDSSPGLPYYS